MNAVISVLLPVYNAAADGGAALRACMASLAAQCGTPDAPLPPVEILALNDGSSDAVRLFHGICPILKLWLDNSI